MGYTRYWTRTEKPITQEFIDEVERIFADCEKRDIRICNWNGKDNPTVTMDMVAFNGNGIIGADHESCVFDNNKTGFDFCKTARKPYDYAVRRVLVAAETLGLVTDVSDDGFCDEISDIEWV